MLGGGVADGAGGGDAGGVEFLDDFVGVFFADCDEQAAGGLRVDGDLGAVARPSRVRFVTVLPKTRSGKLLRRAIQAVCEGRDPGDLTTLDDPSSLQQIRQRLAG